MESVKSRSPEKAGRAKGTAVKICGITHPREAGYLNESGADYAGFVFYPPSKRNISIEKAAEIAALLNPKIKRVAVTVSPEQELVEKIMEAGFDILQIHKKLDASLLEQIKIPVWYAFNVSKTEEVEKQDAFFRSLPEELGCRIQGIVVDGAAFGSGKTFDWEALETGWRSSPIFHGRKLILAGGLTPENVAEGIRIFEPDIADVSSGVETGPEESPIGEIRVEEDGRKSRKAAPREGFRGKDPEKIRAFCSRVKEAQKG